jgi:nucleosome binding factor SPN SPT16 subunit
LTSIEIKYYESKVNLNWKNIIKMIKEVSLTFRYPLCKSLKLAICIPIIPQSGMVQDPEGFVEDGGWNFLDADQSDSEEEEGEEESEFEPR